MWYLTVLYCVGLLSSVESLAFSSQSSAISLSWAAPFTLDITDIDPDITYCVDVVSSSSVVKECDITVTDYLFPLSSNIGCVDVTFTVTPVNVLGEGNKTSLSVNDRG